MSADPRTDFFTAGAEGAPDDSASLADSRTAFFAADKPLAVPKTSATGEPMGAFTNRNDQPELLPMLWEGAKETAQGIVHGAGTLADVATGTAPGQGSHADRWASAISTDPSMGGRVKPEGEITPEQVSKTYDKAFGTGPAAQTFKERIPQALEAITTAVPAVKMGAGIAIPAAKGVGRALLPPVVERTPAAPLSAEEVLARNSANSQGNMGAAAAPPSLEGVSPELKDAISKASNIHSEALQRHIDAETLPMPEGESPMRLRHGQATRDEQQISDEKNLRGDMDTQGLLSQSITDQNKKLGMSMGEIRRRATPDIVQRSSADHGQTAVDAIKGQDNATVLDTRAKYKALEDAAGGSMPIDTGETIKQINDRLKQKLLTRTAAEEPAISEVMAALSSGEPISFETFNNALSNLAEVQRNKGSPAAAATVVRNALESMPLTEEGAKLKGLRDIAAAAAKKRFDTIEQNPAYEAAVNDNVPKTPNGLHRAGTPSPLADSFMDRYFLGNGQTASRAYVDRIKQVLQQNPDFSPAIEASALNKLRDSAKLDEFDEGQFASANFRNTHKAMANKADVLMSPRNVDHVNHLRRVSDDVSYEGKASTVNRSNTALTLQRYGAQYPETPGIKGTLADYGTDLIAAHAGPVGYAAKKIGSKLLRDAKDAKAVKATQAAKLKFAQDATAPGAGINMPPDSPVITRASGGKVDHEVLLNRLVQRWKAAKKTNDADTETLLKAPDASIIRALDIAGRSQSL